MKKNVGLGIKLAVLGILISVLPVFLTNNVYAFDDGDPYQEYEEQAYFSGGGVADSVIYTGATTLASVSVNSQVSNPSALRIEWCPDNSGVVSVNGSGNVVTVRGERAGVAGINVGLYYYDQLYDVMFLQVEVQNQPQQYVSVNGVTISKTSHSMNPGDTIVLTASVLPSNANNQRVTWSSNNPGVAGVDNSGYVRAISSGTAVITVKTEENGFPAYCTITVGGGSYVGHEAVRGVSLNLTTMSLGVGQYMMLIPTVYPADAANKKVYWASDNPAVATVNADGIVAATGVGTTTIHCATADGAKMASAAVTVGAQSLPVNTGFVVTSTTVDPQLNYDTCLKIAAAKKKGTVKVSATAPKSFDATVAAYMAIRPDVKIQCTFPFNGHSFRLTIPAGYNLAALLNPQGNIDWLDLCKLNGQGGIVVTMLK